MLVKTWKWELPGAAGGSTHPLESMVALAAKMTKHNLSGQTAPRLGIFPGRTHEVLMCTTALWPSTGDQSYETETHPLEYYVTTKRAELTILQGIIWDVCWKLNQDEGRAGRHSMCPGDYYLCFKKSEIHAPQVPHNLQREEKKLNTWLPLGPIRGLKSRAGDRLHNIPFVSQTLSPVNILRVLQLVTSSNPSDVTDLGNNPHCCWMHAPQSDGGLCNQQPGCPRHSSPLTSCHRGDVPATAQLHLCATLSNKNLILTIMHPDLTSSLQEISNNGK